MTQPDPSIPQTPGWYNDNDGTTRWWDGTQWTDHTQPTQPTPPPPAQAPQQVIAPVQQMTNNQTVTVNVGQPTLAVRTRKINAIAYLVITVLVGWLGIHRFYRGQIGLGILYLLTAGILGIGWIIDIVLAIIWLIQRDPNGQITFVNKKYARYGV